MEVISAVVKKERSFAVVSSRECARGSLGYLGRATFTYGHFNHCFIALLV
jgi:hypothetical protein